MVLFNAIRGFNAIRELVVPHNITDRMIGFTPEGRTKIWINENFGMNYPSHVIQNATLDQANVIDNLLNAIASRTDLAS